MYGLCQGCGHHLEKCKCDRMPAPPITKAAIKPLPYPRKCPVEGCTDEVLEGNVHCAHHYFSLPENVLRKNWEGTMGESPGTAAMKDIRALDVQVGGGHYKKLAVQPAEYVHANRIPYLEGSVIYYVTRWRDKGGLGDIDKAIHTLQLLKELENGKAKTGSNA